MIVSIDQQKEILKIDRWAAFSPNGDILRSDIDKSLLHSIMKGNGINITDPDYHPARLCSEFDADCYNFESQSHTLICWLGKPEELPVANGFCPMFNLFRYQASCDIKDLEK